MSEADDSDEINEIRERKREELQERASTPTEPVHVEGETHLAELLDDHELVLVDFYADWCGPCKMLEPTVEALAAETPAAVAKVDIDAHQALAQQYQVQGVPTLYLFADGEAVERIVGVRDKADLEATIDQYA